MRRKRGYILLLVVLSLLLLMSYSVLAQENELIDPDIPDSWYETPKLASEMGITEFDQSPMLEERVDEGELPPVEERLPDDPPVMETYKEVGKYGGQINLWNINLQAYAGQIRFFQTRPPLARPTPDGRTNKPLLARDWTYNDDYTEWTIHLREGLKWSDGELFNADDYIFWWEHVANNTDLTPATPEERNIPLLDVTKEGEYKVTFHFGKPNPKFSNYNFQLGLAMDGRVEAEHFMKQFHPDIVGEEKVMEMAEEAGLDTWYDFYERIAVDSASNPQWDNVRPDLAPYIATERTESYLILERNPYYPFVDQEGNQLPYVDKIKVNLANSPEMAATKAATGEATFAARNTSVVDMPLYKRNAEKEDYRVLLYSMPFGNICAIQPNLSHEDPDTREIYGDLRFRKALSYAIDRDEINEKVFYGNAQPMQSTVPPTNKFYKEEYAKAYLDYDPERAEELLDEMGMVDTDGDGYRERPDGEKFNPVLLTTEFMQSQKILELVQRDFDDIGLDVQLKNVSRELLQTRRSSNKFDIGNWSVDCAVDIYFGNLYHLSKSFAPTAATYENPWPGYGAWFDTDGEEGIEPPEEMKQLVEWAETLSSSPDDEARQEAGRNLVKSQAENLWTVGTVSSVPQPIIVKNKLKNVPEKGIWDATLPYMVIYNTEQFYLDE